MKTVFGYVVPPTIYHLCLVTWRKSKIRFFNVINGAQKSFQLHCFLLYLVVQIFVFIIHIFGQTGSYPLWGVEKGQKSYIDVYALSSTIRIYWIIPGSFQKCDPVPPGRSFRAFEYDGRLRWWPCNTKYIFIRGIYLYPRNTYFVFENSKQEHNISPNTLLISFWLLSKFGLKLLVLINKRVIYSDNCELH